MSLSECPSRLTAYDRKHVRRASQSQAGDTECQCTISNSCIQKTRPPKLYNASVTEPAFYGLLKQTHIRSSDKDRTDWKCHLMTYVNLRLLEYQVSLSVCVCVRVCVCVTCVCVCACVPGGGGSLITCCLVFLSSPSIILALLPDNRFRCQCIRGRYNYLIV